MIKEAEITNTVFAPVRQRRHRYIDSSALDWFDVHFVPSGFNGRVFLGYRPPDGGVYTLSCLPINEARDFIGAMHISRRRDYYITANSFSGVDRRADGLFSLHNIVIDIDCHGDHFDSSPFVELFLECFYSELEDEEFIPAPNSIILTGRGLQLWWAIEPVSIKCVWYYEKIKRYLIGEVAHMLDVYDSSLFTLSVDISASVNNSGYFRLPGTYNTRRNAQTRILMGESRRYSTHELIKRVKDEETPAFAEPKPKTHDFAGSFSKEEIYIFKTPGVLGYQRLRQLIELRILRDRDPGDETRNNLCFLVYNALLPLGEEKAWDRLMAFNTGFKEPMSERELKACIVTAKRKGGYKYSNAAVVSLLDITPEEQMAIGLFVPTKPYDPMTRVSPSAGRDASRKLVKADRNAKIINMVESGMSDSAIARELGINRNTVASVRQKSGAKRPETAEDLIRNGLNNEDIAKQLGVSLRTVQRVRAGLKKKAG